MGRLRIGADYRGNGKCEFTVWAPLLKNMEVKLVSPIERIIPMERGSDGCWKTLAEEVFPGTRYFYKLDNRVDRPDPASRFQPDGVHGPSQIIDPNEFQWNDNHWKGISLNDLIIYELHVGTFTREGTFEAIIPHLDYLKELGITAIELMPVAQFPGNRNWGYDGVYPFAPQNSYGGPQGLKTLINACHKKGVSVILDVVYNHLGPEGNYLHGYGPYFTDRYKTPWGDAINFDGPYSDGTREYFVDNALYWITEYHFDALRIDAVQGIFDFSAKHFLQELAEAVHGQAEVLGRNVYVIAESDRNDVRVINPVEIGGYGLDAQWNDDFHHSLHTLITGDCKGYYEDFGKIWHIEKACREGFVYSGEYSQYRKRRHGSSSRNSPANKFIVFSQNHDQVGNRMLGERLTNIASFESLKLAAGTVLLSPYIPLLFMGEEYGEDAPFLYFVSHSDPGLIQAVREGRKEEFKAFAWKGEPFDPQNVETFLKSKIRWEKRREGKHKILLDFYKNLLKLRRNVPALSNLDKERLDVYGFEEDRILFMRRWKNDSHVFCIFNFNREDTKFSTSLPEENWRKLLDSSDFDWKGPGSLLPESISGGEEVLSLRRHSFVIYSKGRYV